MFNNGWHKHSDVMSSYLDRIGAGYVIDNPEPLDFDYVPQDLVCREDYQKKLAARFSSIDKKNPVVEQLLLDLLAVAKLS